MTTAAAEPGRSWSQRAATACGCCRLAVVNRGATRRALLKVSHSPFRLFADPSTDASMRDRMPTYNQQGARLNEAVRKAELSYEFARQAAARSGANSACSTQVLHLVSRRRYRRRHRLRRGLQ